MRKRVSEKYLASCGTGGAAWMTGVAVGTPVTVGVGVAVDVDVAVRPAGGVPTGVALPPYASAVPSLLLTTVKYTHCALGRLTLRLSTSVPRFAGTGVEVGVA